MSDTLPSSSPPLASPKGDILLLLHCHLPFVRHPEHKFFLEENWYFEALFETYLPLLEIFEKLWQEDVPFRLTLSVSPTLLSMCLDPLLQERALRYADLLMGLAQKEAKRVRSLPEFQPVLQMYLGKLERYRRAFLENYHRNVAEGFRKFQDSGHLELITCAATHGFLPLLAVREEAVRAQVETALGLHESFFDKRPRGFWLPECGYQAGLDEILKDYGLEYFFVDSHGLLEAQPRPKYGTFAPIRCPSSGLTAFGRDAESSKQVWSSKEGYPGDPDYREFYRDVGFDLSESELHPYLQPEGIRRFTGLKYFRVTGEGDSKAPYNPDRARQKARAHARDFLSNRRRQVGEVGRWMDRPPLVTCLYDAELFGHWWYEGPDFLYFLFAEKQDGLSFTTPSDFLENTAELQTSQPAFSSWGLGGYSEFWLNEKNQWLYPHLNLACDEMAQLASRFKGKGEARDRALRQAARELLLAQASDWAFMMKTGNHADYAEKRFKTHMARFHRLGEQIRKDRVDNQFLADIEEKDNLFPEIPLGPSQKGEEKQGSRVNFFE